jgi:ribosomal protein S18 acetylase RimI-like enzyme
MGGAGATERLASPSLRRLPFTPVAADSIVAFCLAHECPFDGALVRRLICTMSSDPAGVLVWGDEEGPALVAVVIDRAHSAMGTVHLEILGAVAPLPGVVLWNRVVGPAIAFARGGSGRVLQLSLSPSLVDVEQGEPLLRARGFAPRFTSLVMRRPAALPVPDEPILRAGWRWESLQEPRLDEAHAAIAAAFAGAPSFGLSPLPEFRRAVVAGPDIWQALLEGERIAGLVRVLVLDGQVGEAGQAGDLGKRAKIGKIGMVGRVPALRGRGIGQLLVTRAIRLLAERGAREVTLDVEEQNARASSLYREFGFQVVTRTVSFAIALNSR